MANIADLKNDTAKIAALNTLLDKSAGLLAQSGKAIDLFVKSAIERKDSVASNCAALDTACQRIADQIKGTGTEKVGDSAVAQVKKFIQDAGSLVVIFKVFDREDNDGDGCVDEELLDGIDNDGDGRADEDSRGAPDTVDNPRFRAEKDGADNNLDKTIDEAGEAQFQQRYLASFAPLRLIAFPEKKGQIFWRDTVIASQALSFDARKKVVLALDSTAHPVLDTVSTFDLCKGPIKGFRKGL